MKLNEGFYELKGCDTAISIDKSFNCLLRLPLHKREIPELIIDNTQISLHIPLAIQQKIHQFPRINKLKNIQIKFK